MKDKLGRFDPKTAAAWFFCIICTVIGGYLILKYALAVILPFIIALSLAVITDRPSNWLNRKLRIPKRICSVIILILLLFSLAATVFFTANRLIYESERLLTGLAENSTILGGAISGLFESISTLGDKDIPFIENLMQIAAFREFCENFDSVIATAISDTVSSLTRGIPSLLFSVVGSLPKHLIFLAVTVIASFYFCFDYDRIKEALFSRLTPKLSAKLRGIKYHIFDTAAKFLRAYLTLLLLTFLQLFVGFSILRVPSPFLLACLTALVDFLPVLGVGTVLIPWGLFEIIFYRDFFLGIGLLVLYIIILIVRQFTEPRIVGGSLGLHPLVTLLTMYIGMKLFGIIGMILAPACTAVIRSVLASNIDKGEAL